MSGFSLRQRLVGSDTLTLFGTYVTILHSCAQIWGLYCKTEGYLFWEESHIFTRHEESVYWHYSARNCKRIGSKIWKLRAFKDSNYNPFGASHKNNNSWSQELLPSRTAGAEGVKFAKAPATDATTVNIQLGNIRELTARKGAS